MRRVYRITGPAKVFLTEPDANRRNQDRRIAAGDVLVLMCRGPMGAGMEETYQLTGALKYLPHGKHVAVVTDARFSGVSTGACIGHVSPEALAGGPIGKIVDGDLIEIVIDRRSLEGSVNFVGENSTPLSVDEATRVLTARSPRADLRRPRLPMTRLWAASGRERQPGEDASMTWTRSLKCSCRGSKVLGSRVLVRVQVRGSGSRVPLEGQYEPRTRTVEPEPEPELEP